MLSKHRLPTHPWIRPCLWYEQPETSSRSQFQQKSEIAISVQSPGFTQFRRDKMVWFEFEFVSFRYCLLICSIECNCIADSMRTKELYSWAVLPETMLGCFITPHNSLRTKPSMENRLPWSSKPFQWRYT